MEAADKTDSSRHCAGVCGRDRMPGRLFFAIRLSPQSNNGRISRLHASGPRCVACCLSALYSAGLYFRMMDGSLGEDMKTPMSFEYNADVTRRRLKWRILVVCRLVNWAAWALWKAAWRVKRTAPAQRETPVMTNCTDPEEAAQFVKETG